MARIDLSSLGYNTNIEINDGIRSRVPVIDPNYRPDTRVAGHILRWLIAKRRTKSLFLVGPTGCGKTSLVSHLCAVLNWPLYTLQVHSTLRAEDAEGGMTLDQGTTKFQDSAVVRAYRNGGVLLLDEGNRADPALATWLNAVAEYRPLAVFSTGEEIDPHPDFRLIMTGNAKAGGDMTGAYVDCNPFCVSFANRFRTIEFSYPTQDEEREIVKAVAPGLPKSLVKKMIAASLRLRALRNGDERGRTVSVPWTLRSLIDWADAMENEYHDLPVVESFALTYTNALSDESEIEAVNEIVKLALDSTASLSPEQVITQAARGGNANPQASSEQVMAVEAAQFFVHPNPEQAAPKYWAVAVVKAGERWATVCQWGRVWRPGDQNKARYNILATEAVNQARKTIKSKLAKGYKPVSIEDVPSRVQHTFAANQLKATKRGLIHA